MAASEPIDPDVDLGSAAQRAELRRAPWSVLGAVAVGGALGALARYGLTTAYPLAPGAFPWTTFAINLAGCLLIGVLMAALAASPNASPLTRPFLGVGVLGGFTTFSAYAVDTVTTARAGSPLLAVAYLALTPPLAVAAVAAGALPTRRLLRRRTRP
ncbi:fluoride efflux transporter FluC [Actinomadura flavalba]|uniref:fluoride efflux transporter FluC n=1 Tax=Actinomadura flavalba TaxID=1120938 RepID=UPI00035DDA05|nr:CrcB family protein [Actinomadura flavalba]